jgi:hypothetical protein
MSLPLFLHCRSVYRERHGDKQARPLAPCSGHSEQALIQSLDDSPRQGSGIGGVISRGIHFVLMQRNAIGRNSSLGL